MYYDDARRRPITLVVIAAIVVCGCQVYKMAVTGKANRHLNQAETAVKALDQSSTQSLELLANAQNKHPVNYLSGFQIDELHKLVTEAHTFLDQAKKARHPGAKHRLAARTIAWCGKAGGLSQSWRSEIELLDKALENFETEPEKLLALMNDAAHEADRLEAEGFFAPNFREPRALIAEAEKQRLAALELMKASSGDGAKPDYRRIYLTCLEAEKVVASARSLILGIPKLRDSNTNRAAKLTRDTDTASDGYKSARAAAVVLEQYPGYRCLESVKQAKTRLSLIEPLIDRAVEANSMQRQDFNGASAMLSQADGILAATVAMFDHARNTHSQVQSALANADSARSSAVSAIDRARSHISYNSQNWQSTAKSRLNSAESELNQGDLLLASDPIAALSSFQKAESEADSAYSAVDTSDDDDDNWGSTSSGGGIFGSGSSDDGGVSSSGDGSSSGGGGFGGGSDWGGSSDSGGSFGGGGGEYGGPSGGESGGPSGGESGDGL